MFGSGNEAGQRFAKPGSLNAKNRAVLIISFFGVLSKFLDRNLAACFPGTSRFYSVNFQSSCYPYNPLSSRKVVENVGTAGLEPGL